ncbi:hypothetical protein MTO96_000457 [Rhipicephalus appendiculatus]
MTASEVRKTGGRTRDGEGGATVFRRAHGWRRCERFPQREPGQSSNGAPSSSSDGVRPSVASGGLAGSTASLPWPPWRVDALGAPTCDPLHHRF